MSKKKIVIANWKMNPNSAKDAEKLFVGVNKQISKVKKTEVVVVPPYLYLKALKKFSKKISLGAQDAYYEEMGAYTGEISVSMLYDLGVKHIILGHSERRKMGEDNALINKKVKAVLSYSLTPILCIGESVRDENHEYLNFIKLQIEECLVGIPKNLIAKVIIAYEPIWAIGKNAVREATPEEFREIKIFIKKILSDKFGSEKTSTVNILYGGSVNPKNAESFIMAGGADGFLVGRDSLDPKKFAEIVRICEASSK